MCRFGLTFKSNLTNTDTASLIQGGKAYDMKDCLFGSTKGTVEETKLMDC